MKKRGFGAGKWNGPGGKQLNGETIRETAIRETLEEIGVKIEDFKKAVQIKFYFPDKPEWDQIGYGYIVSKWNGEPKETEEMKPMWFNVNELPLDDMWEADRVWLPKILSGEKIKGEIYFSNEGKVLKMSYH